MMILKLPLISGIPLLICKKSTTEKRQSDMVKKSSGASCLNNLI